MQSSSPSSGSRTTLPQKGFLAGQSTAKGLLTGVLGVILPYVVAAQCPVETRTLPSLCCLAAAFAFYWYACVEHKISLSFMEVLAWGLVARLLLLPMAPSDDMYRYLWEGKVWAHGLNPYLLAPNHPNLAFLRDENWSRINHPAIPAIYQPLTEALFFCLAKIRPSVVLFKIIFVLFDIFSLLVLRKILASRERRADGAAERSRIAEARNIDVQRFAAIFFLNPLLIFEISGRGHFDSLPIFFNLLFLWAVLEKRVWSPLALAIGGLAKINSLILAPMILFTHPRKPLLFWIPAIGAIVGIGLWATGSLHTLRHFAIDFHFNAIIPYLIGLGTEGFLSHDVQRILSLFLFASAMIFALFRFPNLPSERQAFWLTGLLLLFSPTLHPWYVLWILPFAALNLSRPWLLLTGSVLVTYAVYGQAQSTGVWREIPWLRIPEFLPPLVLWLFIQIKSRSLFPARPRVSEETTPTGGKP